jgi:hypothetical protein
MLIHSFCYLYYSSHVVLFAILFSTLTSYHLTLFYSLCVFQIYHVVLKSDMIIFGRFLRLSLMVHLVNTNRKSYTPRNQCSILTNRNRFDFRQYTSWTFANWRVSIALSPIYLRYIRQLAKFHWTFANNWRKSYWRSSGIPSWEQKAVS